MESERSLPHSQDPATYPYSEPNQSSPWPTSWKSTLIFSSYLFLCLPKRCYYQNPIRTYPVSQTCQLPRPSHSSWFDHSNNIWERAEIIKPPFTVNFAYFMTSTSNEVVCDFSEQDGRFAVCLSLRVVKGTPFRKEEILCMFFYIAL